MEQPKRGIHYAAILMKDIYISTVIIIIIRSISSQPSDSKQFECLFKYFWALLNKEIDK